MKKYTIEQLLIAARPASSATSDFVDNTMIAVQKSSNPEIISSVMRKTNEPQTKGWSFMKKLQTLPLGALVLLALGGALVLGGATYATYKLLWEPLVIQRTSVTTEGDKSRVVFDLTGCSSLQGSPEYKSMIESKTNSGVSTQEAEKYVGAYCERNKIHQYGYALVGAETDKAKATSGIWLDYEPVKYSDVLKGEEGDTHTLSGSVQYIVEGEETKENEFKSTDLVFRIMKYETEGESAYSEARVLAIAKATHESKYYDGYLASLSGITHAVPCRNNTDEFCINGPIGSPIYKALPDTAGPSYIPTKSEQRILDAIEQQTTTQFEGSIVAISDDTIIIKTSADRLMKVELPQGAVNQAQETYEPTGVTFGIGSVLHVISIGNNREFVTIEDLVGAYFL